MPAFLPRVSTDRRSLQWAHILASIVAFGFSDKAKLDDGALWPTAFALQELTAAAETMIGALVKRAAG